MSKNGLAKSLAAASAAALMTVTSAGQAGEQVGAAQNPSSSSQNMMTLSPKQGDDVITLAQAGSGSRANCPPQTCMTNEDRRNALREDVKEINAARKANAPFDLGKYNRLVSLTLPNSPKTTLPYLALIGAGLNDEVGLVAVSRDAAHERTMSEGLARFAREWNLRFPDRFVDSVFLVFPGDGNTRDSKGNLIDKDVAGNSLADVIGPDAHGLVMIMFNGVFRTKDSQGKLMRLTFERDQYGVKLSDESTRTLAQQLHQARKAYEIFLRDNPQRRALPSGEQRGSAGEGKSQADGVKPPALVLG